MSKLDKYLRIILILSFFALLLLGVLETIPGDDYLWHIKIGEWILENKEVPKTGIYSWTCSESQWFAHEWLAAIPMYLCTLISSKHGCHIFLITTISLIAGILAYINRDRFLKNPIFTISWACIGYFIITNFNTPRPHYITFSLLITYLIILDKIKRNDYKYLFLIPIIAIIWSNVHGGSSNLLYLFPIGFILTGIRNWNIGRLTSKKLSSKQILIYLGIIVSNIFCICLNPRGIELLTYPYSYSDIKVHYISEWVPLSYANLKLPFLAMIIILGLIIISKRKKLELSEIGIIGLFILLSFMHLRFSIWTYFITSIYIFKYVDKLEIPEKKASDIKLFFNIFLTLTVITIFGYSFIADLSTKEILSDEIIEIIKEDSPERLYNEYNFGGYLISKDIDVYIDGRADMYHFKEMFEESIEATFWSKNFEKRVNDLIDEYNFDAFLVYKDGTYSYVLENSEKYELIYEDDSVLYYKEK